ncbi:MAG: hypothetical protein RQ758_07020 [Methanomicrobiaceae archaeon]|nr:hypothetical protein [Methanomicrobiaceae archaeon]
MNDEDLAELIKPISTKDLRAELKKRGLKAGRCPTKTDLARLLPEDRLRELAGK